MTRRCAVCKETNYKNNSSFFSAPKDRETREKWQAVMDTDQDITDDFFVCSRHFHKRDIIRHWVSGVPPHVITIKYKKCRLRPGAVPDLEIVDSNRESSDEDSAEYHVNQSSREANNSDEEMFAIPREKEDSCKKTINSYERVKKTNNKHVFNSICGDSENYTHVKVLSLEQAKNLDLIPLHTTSDKEKRLLYPINSKEDIEIEEATTYEEGCEDVSFHAFDDISTEIDHVESDAYDTSEINMTSKHDQYMEVYVEEPRDQSMLFEDLLEVYNEVKLPQNWSSMVTSKGIGMTVIYLNTVISTNGLPIVERQVFVKNDMTLECSAANVQIDPLIHNLVNAQNLKVTSLKDIEEFIWELSKRTICEGFSEEGTQCDDTVMTRQRHKDCSILMNTESNRCSKCAAIEKSMNPLSYTSLVLRKKEKKIQELRKIIRNLGGSQVNVSKKLTHKDLISRINTLKIPKVQKLMIEECLNATDSKGLKFSQNWLFLCLHLYTESPQAYELLMDRDLMSLPSLKFIRQYLRQVNVNRSFHQLYENTIKELRKS